MSDDDFELNKLGDYQIVFPKSIPEKEGYRQLDEETRILIDTIETHSDKPIIEFRFKTKDARDKAAFRLKGNKDKRVKFTKLVRRGNSLFVVK